MSQNAAHRFADGTVNTADLTLLLNNFGNACDYSDLTWDFRNQLLSYTGVTASGGSTTTESL